MFSPKCPVVLIRLGVKSLHNPQITLPQGYVCAPLSASILQPWLQTSGNKVLRRTGPVLSAFLGSLDTVANVSRTCAVCQIQHWVPGQHASPDSILAVGYLISILEKRPRLRELKWLTQVTPPGSSRAGTQSQGQPDAKASAYNLLQEWRCCCNYRRLWCFIACLRARLTE